MTYYTPPLIGRGLYAAQFDGALTFAHTVNLTLSNTTTQRTLEMWINPFGGMKAKRECSNSPALGSDMSSNNVISTPYRQTLVQGVYDDQGLYAFVFGLLTAPVLSSGPPATAPASTGGTPIPPVIPSPFNFTLFNESSYILYFSNNNITNSVNLPNETTNSTAQIEVYSDALVQIPANTWTHVAMTIDQALVTFYINGNRAGTRTASPIPIFPRVVLGAQLVSPPLPPPMVNYVDPGDSQYLIRSHVYCGVMDEFRLWAVTLDQLQVGRSMLVKVDDINDVLADPTTSMLSQQQSSQSNPLVAYWDFNEGKGNITVDRAGVQTAPLYFGTGFDFDQPKWVISNGTEASNTNNIFIIEEI